MVWFFQREQFKRNAQSRRLRSLYKCNENLNKSIKSRNKVNVFSKDTLGLRTLDQQGKLFRLSVDGNHLEMSHGWFIDNIVIPFLKD